MRTILVAAAFALVTAVAVAAPPMGDKPGPEVPCSSWFLAPACPDGTAAITRFTGQGRGGDGWAGNASGAGGPSATPYSVTPSDAAAMLAAAKVAGFGSLSLRPPAPPRSARSAG
jgi:hypothetical protein